MPQRKPTPRKSQPHQAKRPPFLDRGQTVSLLVVAAFGLYLVWRLMPWIVRSARSIR